MASSSSASFMSAAEVADWASSHVDPNIANCAPLLLKLNCTSSSLQRVDIVQDLVSEGLPIITAKDLVACFLVDFKSEAIVLWDLENIPVPAGMSASAAVSAIRASLRSIGLTRSSIQVYGTRNVLSSGDEKKRADLSTSGCHVIDTPHDGAKEVADKMLLVDAAMWAADHPPPAKLVFLTSDRDMSYLMSLLRSRGYTIILIYTNIAAQRLQNAASVCLHWQRDVLKTMPLRQRRSSSVEPLSPFPSILTVDSSSASSSSSFLPPPSPSSYASAASRTFARSPSLQPVQGPVAVSIAAPSNLSSSPPPLPPSLPASAAAVASLPAAEPAQSTSVSSPPSSSPPAPSSSSPPAASTLSPPPSSLPVAPSPSSCSVASASSSLDAVSLPPSPSPDWCFWNQFDEGDLRLVMDAQLGAGAAQASANMRTLIRDLQDHMTRGNEPVTREQVQQLIQQCKSKGKAQEANGSGAAAGASANSLSAPAASAPSNGSSPRPLRVSVESVADVADPAPSPRLAYDLSRLCGPLCVRDDDDVLSVAGSEEEEAEARAAGIQELVQVIKAMMQHNRQKKEFATATVGDTLARTYPLLKKERYPSGWLPLWLAAKQAGLIEVKTRPGPTGLKHYFLVPHQDKFSIEGPN